MYKSQIYIIHTAHKQKNMVLKFHGGGWQVGKKCLKKASWGTDNLKKIEKHCYRKYYTRYTALHLAFLTLQYILEIFLINSYRFTSLFFYWGIVFHYVEVPLFVYPVSY